MLEEVTQAIENRKTELFRICRELLRRPSPNPPGDTRGVASFVAGYLEGEGIETTTLAAHPELPAVLARVQGKTPGRHLTLIVHMDTFPVSDPDSWSFSPFGGESEGSRIYGRGASDTKGGLATAMVVLAALRDFQEELAGQVDLVVVSGGVSFSPEGAPYVLSERPDVIGDAAIALEPLYHGAIGCGEKGAVWAELVARGTGGGGFEAGSGESTGAVEVLLEFLGRLRELEGWRADLPGDVGQLEDVLQRVTLSIGLLDGGRKVNLVPRMARARVDIRLPLGVSCSEVEAFLDELVQSWDGVTWRELWRSEPNYSDPDAAIFGALQRAVHQVQGSKLPVGMYLPASDARLFRRRRISAASFGPPAHGEGRPDEYILASDLVWVAKSLMLAVINYC